MNGVNDASPFLAAAALLVFSFAAGSVETKAPSESHLPGPLTPRHHCSLTSLIVLVLSRLFVTFLRHCRTFRFLFSWGWFCHRKHLISKTCWIKMKKKTFVKVFIHLALLCSQQHLKQVELSDSFLTKECKCICIFTGKTAVHDIESATLLSCKYKLPFFVFSLLAAGSEGIIAVKWPCS